MNPGFKITFHPGRSGIRKFFGDLEAEVMEIVWANNPVTVKRVLYFLKKKRDYAYTTAMTVLNRLALKGYLKRVKKSHAYTYIPALNREEFLKYAVKQVMKGLQQDFKPYLESNPAEARPGSQTRKGKRPQKASK